MKTTIKRLSIFETHSGNKEEKGWQDEYGAKDKKNPTDRKDR